MRKTEALLWPLTLRQLVDEALRLRQLTTYQDLAMRMGMHANTLYQWVEGKRIPYDNSMLMLATFAEIYPFEALLLLNWWRAEGRAKNVYMKWLRLHGFHYWSEETQAVEWHQSNDAAVEAEIQRRTKTSQEQIHAQ